MYTESIDRFLKFRRPNTKRTYRRALSDLLEWLNCKTQRAINAQLSKLTPQRAAAFLSELKEKVLKDGTQMSHATLRLKLNALRSMFGHLVALEELDRNPWLAVKDLINTRQAVQKRPTAKIPASKVNEVLSLPNIRRKEGVRDRALLAVMFGGGLRRSEVLSLKVGSVMVTPQGTLYLSLTHTKSGKAREAPLPKWAAEHFSLLVSQRKAEGATEKDFLFPFYYRDGRWRGCMGAKTLYRTFCFYCTMAGLKAAPHAARAAFATRLKEQGFEDRAVADALGHSTTHMVQVYDKRGRGAEENCAKSLIFPA